jgi:hypothetical protein
MVPGYLLARRIAGLAANFCLIAVDYNYAPWASWKLGCHFFRGDKHTRSSIVEHEGQAFCWVGRIER